MKSTHVAIFLCKCGTSKGEIFCYVFNKRFLYLCKVQNICSATLLIACKPQKLFVTFGHAVGTIKGILFERRRCIAKVLFTNHYKLQNLSLRLFHFLNNFVKSIYNMQKSKTKVLPYVTVGE